MRCVCVFVTILTGVRKPTTWLPASPRKALLTNVNSRTLRVELNCSMRVGRTPVNRLCPAELLDRTNVLQPQQTEKQPAQCLNKVHRIKAVHRKRKWRWRHLHRTPAQADSNWDLCPAVCDNSCDGINGHLLGRQFMRRYQLWLQQGDKVHLQDCAKHAMQACNRELRLLA